MLDIHCHIVPYTDDGAVDINASLEMAKNAQKLGYNGIFATSHYIIHDNEIENKFFINNIKKLNEMFEIENINVKVYEGNEILYGMSTVSRAIWSKNLQDSKGCTRKSFDLYEDYWRNVKSKDGIDEYGWGFSFVQ